MLVTEIKGIEIAEVHQMSWSLVSNVWVPLAAVKVPLFVRPHRKVGIASCVSFQVPQLLIVTAQTNVLAPEAAPRVSISEMEVVPVTVIAAFAVIFRVPVVIVRLPPIVVATPIRALVLVVFSTVRWLIVIVVVPSVWVLPPVSLSVPVEPVNVHAPERSPCKETVELLRLRVPAVTRIFPATLWPVNEERATVWDAALTVRFPATESDHCAVLVLAPVKRRWWYAGVADTFWATEAPYSTVVPLAILIVPNAGKVVPIVEPRSYVPWVRLRTEEPERVMTDPQSWKRLAAATSPIVRVVRVIPAPREAPVAAVLLTLRWL
jgi:hypothetical protein